MAFHIKSTTKFKALIGFSALAVSSVAALFSVTGVSTLFKGAWLTVVLMMGILEFAKIVVASYVARFWNVISKTLRTYFTIAIIVLMLITSAGIFGYLSEAYQGTKGNYDITEQESNVLVSKRKNYEEQIQRYKDRVNILNSFRAGQESRLDSLYSRKLIASAKRVELNIQRNDAEMQSLNDKISALTDSVGTLSTQVITKQSTNIKGELGPLKFIADAFGTDMDSVVKYLILMLIFVFDPLAVLLFVSLSVMIRKESEIEKIPEEKVVEPEKKAEEKQIEQSFKSSPADYNAVILNDDDNTSSVEFPAMATVDDDDAPQEKNVEPQERIEEASEEISKEEKELDEVMEGLSVVPTVTVNIEPEIKLEETLEEVKNPEEEIKKEHEFYHGDQKIDEPNTEPPAGPAIEWRTANWKPPHK